MVKYNTDINPKNGKILLISEAYPVPGDIYSGVFVHRRVLAYKEKNIHIDIFRYKRSLDGQVFSYEGIDVKCGYKESLQEHLRRNDYDTILVHFLNKDIWDTIKNLDCRIIIWVHGYEIQPWYRRIFDIQDPDAYRRAVNISNNVMLFWRELLSDFPENVHLIFVSKHFKDDAINDIGVDLDPRNYSIIHNYINSALFKYQLKNISERTKVLTIRNFSNRKYANDLLVNTILELSTRPFFYNLSFKIVGDGSMFDEILAPLSNLKNVSIEKKFLSGNDYIDAFNGYGIFLIPTRMDAQGVTRDEAMSTGMVPITNSSSAIPEFVDSNSGILAEPEDYLGLANGIEMLFEQPELFRRLSKGAAERVRKQSGYEQTIKREIDLILNTSKND